MKMSKLQAASPEDSQERRLQSASMSSREGMMRPPKSVRRPRTWEDVRTLEWRTLKRTKVD